MWIEKVEGRHEDADLKKNVEGKVIIKSTAVCTAFSNSNSLHSSSKFHMPNLSDLF